MTTAKNRSLRLGSEVFVIVVGVLIALWAEGQVAVRGERSVLSSQLAEVRSELAAARALLVPRFASLEEEASSLRRLASLNQDGRAPAADSLPGLVNGAFMRVNNYRPNLAALRDLLDSGRMSLIEGAELRSALAELQELLLRVDGLERANQSGPQQALFDPFVVRNFPSALEKTALGGDPEFPSRHPEAADWSALRSPEARGLIAFRSATGSVTRNWWERLDAQMSNTIAEIDRELGR